VFSHPGKEGRGDWLYRRGERVPRTLSEERKKGKEATLDSEPKSKLPGGKEQRIRKRKGGEGCHRLDRGEGGPSPDEKENRQKSNRGKRKKKGAAVTGD